VIGTYRYTAIPAIFLIPTSMNDNRSKLRGGCIPSCTTPEKDCSQRGDNGLEK